MVKKENRNFFQKDGYENNIALRVTGYTENSQAAIK